MKFKLSQVHNKHIVFALIQIAITIAVYISVTAKFPCTCQKYHVSLPLAKASGFLISFNLITLLFSSFLRSTVVHNLSSITIVIASILHTICHTVNYIKVNSKAVFSNVIWTGIILWVLLFCVMLVSFAGNRYYTHFYIYHTFGFSFIVIGSMIHGSWCFYNIICNKTQPFIYILPFFCFYLFVKLFAYVRYPTLTLLNHTIHDNNDKGIIELSLNWKGDKPIGGKTVYLNCPQLNILTWHPFTVVEQRYHGDVKNGQHFVIFIKVFDNWTQQLKHKLNTQKQLSFKLDRQDTKFPYKAIHNSKKHVFICSGIGLTKYLYLFTRLTSEQLHNCYFVFIVQNISELTPFLKYLHPLRQCSFVKLFVTQDKSGYSSSLLDFDVIYSRPDFHEIFRHVYLHNRHHKAIIYFSGNDVIRSNIRSVINLNHWSSYFQLE